MKKEGLKNPDKFVDFAQTLLVLNQEEKAIQKENITLFICYVHDALLKHSGIWTEDNFFPVYFSVEPTVQRHLEATGSSKVESKRGLRKKASPERATHL